MKRQLMITTMSLAALLAGSAIAAEGDRPASPPSSGSGASSGGAARSGGDGAASNKERAPAQKTQGNVTGAAPKAEGQTEKSADAPAKKDDSQAPKGKAANKDANPDKAANKDAASDKAGEKPMKGAADKSDANKPANEKAAAGQSPADKPAADKAAETNKPNAPGDQQKAAVKKVEITGEKRTRVTSVFTKHRSEARTDINIQVNVGATVPRSAKLYTIPQDVVIVVPEYRSYRYIIVGESVVIIDPADYTIIDVIPLVA